MKYAVKNQSGAFSGVIYEDPGDQVRQHHINQGQELVPVTALTAENGSWVETLPSVAEIAAGISVTRFQARAALLQAGKLAAVEAAVAASGDEMVRLAWSESIHFPRNSPTIAALASAIGLTADDLDALFIAASQISA